MKTSLRILGILLLGLFAISVVGCWRTEDPPQPPPIEDDPPSPEEQLTGQYRLTWVELKLEVPAEAELELDELIFELEPPDVTGDIVMVNGGSFFMAYVYHEDGTEVVWKSDKWSATDTNIILEDDPTTITYTLSGTDLRLVLAHPDLDGAILFKWEKKA